MGPGTIPGRSGGDSATVIGIPTECAKCTATCEGITRFLHLSLPAYHPRHRSRPRGPRAPGGPSGPTRSPFDGPGPTDPGKKSTLILPAVQGWGPQGWGPQGRLLGTRKNLCRKCVRGIKSQARALKSLQGWNRWTFYWFLQGPPKEQLRCCD